MITSILDQAVKLVGRGYVVAALIPSLLFTAVVGLLVSDRESLLDIVSDWAGEPAREATAQLLLALAVPLLFAYVIYGLHGLLHRTFQGLLPKPLSFLMAPALWLATRRFRALRRDLKSCERAMNVFDWALRTDDRFEKAYHEPPVDCEEARRRLKRAEAGAQGAGYQQLLEDAHVLQASAHALPSLSGEIETLVASVKRAYDADDQFREAVARSDAAARRRWRSAYDQLATAYPYSEEYLRPTRLGNTISALETYPLDRYGIDLGALWPRLTHFVHQDLRSRINDRSVYLDFTLVMATLSVAAAAVATVEAFYTPRALFTRIAIPIGFLGLFWVFYRLGVYAAQAFAIDVQAAVDLHRLALLDALALKRPQSPVDERIVWRELRAFIAQAQLPNLQFQQPPADARDDEHVRP